MKDKPLLLVVSGRPADTDRVAMARRRFGAQFAHEPGSTWKKKAVPVLTQWMQTRGTKR